MILDDPTSSLDNKVTSSIINRICKHPKWSKKTYIISTRKISVLKKMDKVIFIEDGEVSFFGPFEQLKNQQKFIKYTQSQEEEEKNRDNDLEYPPSGKPYENDIETDEVSSLPVSPSNSLE